MTELTDEQKYRYLAAGGTRCPACESPDVIAADVVPDGRTATAAARCQTCRRTWKDVWTLIGIEEDDR